MFEDEFAFRWRPLLDGAGIDDAEDVMRLLEEEEIQTPEAYGFDSVEELTDYVLEEVFGEAWEHEADYHEEKWRQFADVYDEAGEVLYNPENTDEYYTDKTGLSAEDIE